MPDSDNVIAQCEADWRGNTERDGIFLDLIDLRERQNAMLLDEVRALRLEQGLGVIAQRRLMRIKHALSVLTAGVAVVALYWWIAIVGLNGQTRSDSTFYGFVGIISASVFLGLNLVHVVDQASRTFAMFGRSLTLQAWRLRCEDWRLRHFDCPCWQCKVLEVTHIKRRRC